MRPGRILALDTASPTVSVAVARDGRPLAERREEIRRSSVRLLGMIDEVLAEAGCGLGELAGLVVLAGPGSFTGLRVGMATALGLHQASGVPATAVPTLDTLALCAPAGRPAWAVVDVLRGEWAAQPFAARTAGEPARPSAAAERLPGEVIVRRAAAAGALVVGFGAARLTAGALEPEALAETAAGEASRRPPEWEPARLIEPLYFRPPPTTPPRTTSPAAGERHR